jgi:hypothetical protein
MYPTAELSRLAAHKAVLRRRIAAQRRDCAAAASVLARPVAWLDRAITLGRQLLPLARTVLGALGLAWAWRRQRASGPSSGRRWLPLLLGALQLLARWSGQRSR